MNQDRNVGERCLAVSPSLLQVCRILTSGAVPQIVGFRQHSYQPQILGILRRHSHDDRSSDADKGTSPASVLPRPRLLTPFPGTIPDPLAIPGRDSGSGLDTGCDQIEAGMLSASCGRAIYVGVGRGRERGRWIAQEGVEQKWALRPSPRRHVHIPRGRGGLVGVIPGEGADAGRAREKKKHSG